MTNSVTVNSLMNQQDPVVLLMMSAISVQQSEAGIQSSASTLLEAFSNAASLAISAGNQILQIDADAVSGATTSSAVEKAQAQYSTDQAKVSNTQNLCSTLTQGQGTVVSDLTQVQQQALGLCQCLNDFNSNTLQNIMSWGN